MLHKLQTPYEHFDLELTEEQKHCLEKLNITESNNYVNYGDLDNLVSELEKYILTIGENDAHICMTTINLIVELIKKVIAHFQQETALIMVRASVPNEAFKMPRWHQDGYYYAPFAGDQYKAAITLKGPGTLFYKLPSEQRLAFEAISDDRAALSQMLDDPSKVESPAYGKGSFFVVGNKQTSAVHSEPHINCHRLFLSVLPASKAQIKENHDRQLAFEAAMR